MVHHLFHLRWYCGVGGGGSTTPPYCKLSELRFMNIFSNCCFYPNSIGIGGQQRSLKSERQFLLQFTTYRLAVELMVTLSLYAGSFLKNSRNFPCLVQGKCKYQLHPIHSRKLETSLVNTNGLRFFFSCKRERERGKRLEVALYPVKLYLCAKTSNWCCSIKYSKHLLPALLNVSQNSESWNFIVLLVRRASHWEQMPSLSS